MERLWAPWRLSYVSGTDETGGGGSATPKPASTGCIFCDKPQETGAEADTRNLIVARGETCFVILNAYPYNNGHLMVVPYRHLSHPGNLTPEENAELMATASHVTTLLDRIYRPDGYNIGMNVGGAAGAGIAAHLHLHVVPRWNGDTNFMPVVGGVKVMPETLEQTYAKIAGAFVSASTTAAGE